MSSKWVDMMREQIDFVIAWVDGSDEEWQKSRKNYLEIEDSDLHMYRDWDNLQYWFRGVEKFAPWVNRIHFVTCGHLPKWLKTDHPKLNIVKHSDYIPNEYIPTFSSHAIELNLHRIPGLEEEFVYFNDDTFILKQLHPTDFFRGGLPCETAILSNLAPRFPGDPYFHYLVNNIAVINHNFEKKQVMRKNPGRWFSLRYGRLLLNNIYFAPVGRFAGFLSFHMPTAFLKSTFHRVWEMEPDMLHATSLNKFRTLNDVNQYVFSYWQFASGSFAPRKAGYGRFFELGRYDQKLFHELHSGNYRFICINDGIHEKRFDENKEIIKKHLEQELPEKSSFEL